MKVNLSKTEKFFIACLFCIIAFQINSCKEDVASPNTPAKSNFEKPPLLNDGWDVDYPNQVGINETPIIDMLRLLDSNANRIHSVLIIKDGKLVFEKYFGGYRYIGNPPGSEGAYITYGYDTLHYEASVSKSVASAIFSIAVDKGYFPDLEDKLINQMPQYSSILTGNKANISLKHLLTMSSGLAWDESTYPYGDPRNDVTALFLYSDPISFILSKALISTPGANFLYSSGSPNVISHLITLKTGLNFINFAEQNLFTPLGITSYKWEKIRYQYYFASGGLWLTPRSLAKIGYLYLNKGMWKGTRIISENMINQSLANYINPGWPNSNGYGFYWWRNSASVNGHTINYNYAAGWGEQLMFLVPQENMLVLINSGYYTVPITLSPFNLFHNYILSSVGK